jgi:hypothetical protein
MFAILFLIALNPVFWGLFEQAGGSLNLYTDRYVDRQGVPTSLFQSINPIYIVLLAPLFAGLWSMARPARARAFAPAKFGLALVQVGPFIPGLRLGRQARRRGGADPGLLRLSDLPAANHGRAVPLASRPSAMTRLRRYTSAASSWERGST